MTRRALLLAVATTCLAQSLPAEVSPGEILISEMNCVACHEATAPVKARLASRQSPKLGPDGARPTPHWLRAFLEDPQAIKPSTLMPDMLQTLPPEERGTAAEALTHFLISIQTGGPAPTTGASKPMMDAGARLYHQLGCVQCHAPEQLPGNRPDDTAAREELERLRQESVPIADLSQKFTVSELSAFLRDPLKSRPSGRMPALNLAGPEADAIAMWLLRKQAGTSEPRKEKGLRFDYYEKEFPELPDFDRLKPDASGIAKTISLDVARRKTGFALRFTGTITVPKDGDYKFYTASDDGSRLYINGQLIVENAGIHPKQSRDGTVKLTAGSHTISVLFFEGGGNRALDVLWKGPDIEKQKIPAEVLSHDTDPMVPVGSGPFTVDAAKAARGREYFGQLQCASCHAGTDAASPRAKPLAELRSRQPAGCIAPTPKPGTPHFTLTERQRVVIQAALANQEALTVPLTAEQQIHRTMTTLNCYACHHRDRRGGADGLRREYLAIQGETDLGEEGRIPPSLTGVGAKLRPEWITTLLETGGKVRPYMATRMPVFGKDNVRHLPELFDKADSRPDALPQPDVFAPSAASDANKFGRKLIGTGGLSCIACHTFAGNKSLGIPALDLATSAQRLKWDWFRRYLLDPQSLRPGTRMPTFWPDGVAARKDVLDGNTEKQIGSIWAYLARKNFTDLPTGLVQGKEELIADREAIIYRNFIDGGGPRAIGVGYPEKANIAFDADQVRLALVWQGSFIDAARHRSGRGQGFEKPLGVNVTKAPPGAPFAVLQSESEPWPDKSGKEAGYHFRGYRLDGQRRPAFLYSFKEITVEDFPVALGRDEDSSIRRTITLHAGTPAPEHLYFRAAVDERIETQPDGSIAVGERLKMNFPGSTPTVRKIGDKFEVLIPLKFNGADATLTQEFHW